MKIAIIGSGISGLSAALLLSQKHQITLFEKDNRFGGHANTVEIKKNNKSISVDTGFIVFNNKNYPDLINYVNTKYLKLVEDTESPLAEKNCIPLTEYVLILQFIPLCQTT